MPGLLYQGRDVGAPEGVSVVQGTQFAGLPVMGKPTALVIHETVTRSAETTFRVLSRRGCEVPLVGPPEGGLIQHADLGARCDHAGGVRNPIAIGLEVVNPFYPHLLPKKNNPWKTVLPNAPWAHKGAYVVPTPERAEACARWIEFATAPGSPVGIPREWPGLDVNKGTMAMGRVNAPLRRGILAHTYFGHSDGSWLVLYAWLRLEAGMSPEIAHDEAIRRTSAGLRTASVRDILLRLVREA